MSIPPNVVHGGQDFPSALLLQAGMVFVPMTADPAVPAGSAAFWYRSDLDAWRYQDVAGNVRTIGGHMVAQDLAGPGALSVAAPSTRFSSTGVGNALTLADGLYVGQRKTITHVVRGGGTGTGVVTPAHATNFATLTLTALFDSGTVEWDGAAWRPVFTTGSAAFA